MEIGPMEHLQLSWVVTFFTITNSNGLIFINSFSVSKNQDRYHIYFDSLNESKERLLNLLQLLNYSKGVRIMHVRSTHYPIILEIIKRKQLQLEYDDANLLYYLTKEQAIRLHNE